MTISDPGLRVWFMSISPDRWTKVTEIFDEALGVEPSSRRGFVRERSGGDEEIEREVTSLLDSTSVDSEEFERPAIEWLEGLSVAELVDTPSRAGQRIGPYELIREVGHGGMGTIYEAVRTDDGRRVAIKTIARGGRSSVILRRFRQERQILASLEHPNIASLYDGGITEDGHPYFVMEFVEGRPIDAHCTERQLTARQRLLLVRQVCGAVQYAHRKLVVHRDIKPSNVLVTADGTVKLLDFGIAKLLPQEGVGEVLTASGLHALTTAYASPEQVRGDPIATASDIYSLGVVLYELLTGRPPFPPAENTPLALQRRICDEVPLRPSEAVAADRETRRGLGPPNRLARTLRGELDDIVMMALRKEPERRYASAEHLSDDLRRYLEHRPVLARPDSLGYRARKFIRRYHVSIAAAAVAAASLAIGTAGVVVQRGVAQEERDRARAAATVATRERAKAERVSQFLENMLGAADPSWYSTAERPGPQTTIGTIFETAGRRVDAELANTPDVRASILRTLGRANAALQRTDLAEQQLQSSLALHRQLYGNDHVEVANDEHELGNLYIKRVDIANAEKWMRQSLATFARIHDDTSDGYGRAVNDMGLVLSGRGQPAEAEPYFRKAAAHRRRFDGAPSPGLAIIVGNLGLALDSQGKFAEAEQAYRESLSIFASFPQRDYLDRGYSHNNHALVLSLRGQ
jgi:serine/threonine-protein kinase